jgi:hypothetical protein
VIADWLAVLNRPSIHGVMIWRWFTDPAAGGPDDTDFTVQGKPAEAVLSCVWNGICRKLRSEFEPGADHRSGVKRPGSGKRRG